MLRCISAGRLTPYAHPDQARISFWIPTVKIKKAIMQTRDMSNSRSSVYLGLNGFLRPYHKQSMHHHFRD